MADGRDYETLWQEVGPTLWSAVYAFSGGRREIADDAVAEAFARVMARDESVRDPAAYCYRVAFRVATAELRREAKSAPKQLLGQSASQEEAVAILQALKELPPMQRAAVYLHYQADLPVREIADLLGSSGAAIRVNLMRGRRRLAALLEEDP